jgi:hypothetical protein
MRAKKKMYMSRHLRAFAHCSCELFSIYGFCHWKSILPTSQVKRRACNARVSKSIVRPDKSRTSLIVLEEHANALTVVDTADGLSEDVADLQDLQLGAPSEVLFLRHGVGGDDFVNRTGVDTLNSISREHAVSDECVDFLSAFLLQKLGGTSDGVGGISQVVYKNGSAATNFANE